mmetsp:Transcript_37874/g.80185  ORF Transcript_37874/g.80185 Transcript_37874/m.80185 type:complete len:206 (+) Transcript_37874:197-814(+)
MYNTRGGQWQLGSSCSIHHPRERFLICQRTPSSEIAQIINFYSEHHLLLPTATARVEVESLELCVEMAQRGGDVNQCVTASVTFVEGQALCSSDGTILHSIDVVLPPRQSERETSTRHRQGQASHKEALGKPIAEAIHIRVCKIDDAPEGDVLVRADSASEVVPRRGLLEALLVDADLWRRVHGMHHDSKVTGSFFSGGWDNCLD